MEDRYLNISEAVVRLVSEYKKYSSLFVAYDFDSTVFDYHSLGDTYQKVESLLIKAKQMGCKLILFTGNEGEKLVKIEAYCREHGYPPDFVNKNPIMETTKPYYNILLDDRAGLDSAYQTLNLTLNIINHE